MFQIKPRIFALINIVFYILIDLLIYIFVFQTDYYNSFSYENRIISFFSSFILLISCFSIGVNIIFIKYSPKASSVLDKKVKCIEKNGVKSFFNELYVVKEPFSKMTIIIKLLFPLTSVLTLKNEKNNEEYKLYFFLFSPNLGIKNSTKDQIVLYNKETKEFVEKLNQHEK